MFYVLSKLLDLLLAPLSWGLLLLGCGLLLGRRRAGPWLVGAAGIVLWVFSAEPVANGLAGLAERGVHPTERPGVVYDAAIVLGGGLDPAASLAAGRADLNAGGDRLVAGLELLLRGRARNLLVSAGGPDPGGPVEADWSVAWLTRLGASPDRIVVERESRNTRENAVNAARIVREKGWRSLLLVTSAMHVPRAAAAFRKAGLAVDVLPVDFRHGAGERWNAWPRATALERSTEALRELSGRVAYRVAGYSAP